MWVIMQAALPQIHIILVIKKYIMVNPRTKTGERAHSPLRRTGLKRDSDWLCFCLVDLSVQTFSTVQGAANPVV